jgi:uncharacterized protein (DUF362 family)
MEARSGDKVVIIEDKNKVLNISALLCHHPELFARIRDCNRVLIKVNIPYWITPPGSLTCRETLLKLRNFMRWEYDRPVYVVESRYGWIPTKLNQEYGLDPEDVLDLFFTESFKARGVALDGSPLSLHVSDVVINPDNFIITLGPPKTHEFVGYTGAVKTCMGFLQDERRRMHGTIDTSIFKGILYDPGLWILMVSALHKNLSILRECIRPDISILDGTSCMEGDGPVFGTEVNWPVYGVSNDPVSLDYAMALMMDLDPESIFYIWSGMRQRNVMKEEIWELSQNESGFKNLMRSFVRIEKHKIQSEVSRGMIKEAMYRHASS